jgi:hypothetical protein
MAVDFEDVFSGLFIKAGDVILDNEAMRQAPSLGRNPI